MGTSEKDNLYGEAIYWHLIAKGYSEYQARVEARRIIARLQESDVTL